MELKAAPKKGVGFGVDLLEDGGQWHVGGTFVSGWKALIWRGF
jgi:hypothetical protein